MVVGCELRLQLYACYSYTCVVLVGLAGVVGRRAKQCARACELTAVWLRACGGVVIVDML